MSQAELTELAERLEQYLGDPRDPASRMSFPAVLDHDERDSFPYAFVSMLHRWGFLDYGLPAEQGGKAGNPETGFTLMRLVARRDGATAIALGLTNAAFTPVWIAGTDEQKRRQIDDVHGGVSIAWGLSEAAHGSDLLSNEVVAEKVPGGYRVTGEKWPIGNATFADRMVVFARTGPRGGAGDYSILVVDKWRAEAETLRETPLLKLHGVRALDLSGLRMDGVFVPESDRIGAEGQGLEIALKTSQTARVVILSLALSGVDTSLRTALEFAQDRVLFNTPVIESPYTGRQLAECFADLMVADAVCLGAVRSVQASPAQVSVWSSVAKYVVPTLLEQTHSRLSVVLGARTFLRTHPRFGMHQKMLRDLMVTNVADGNTVVNLRNIGHQLASLLERARAASPELRREAAERTAVLYAMDAELPLYRPHLQELSSRGLDDAILAAPDALVRLRVLADRAADKDRDRLLLAADVAGGLLGRLGPLEEQAQRLRAELGRGYATSAELFDLAQEYCLVHAAAACVHTYVHSQESMVVPLPSAALLLLQLERLNRQFHPYEPYRDPTAADEVLTVLTRLHGENRLLSHWPITLAERTAPAEGARCAEAR
ncbi:MULTISPECIES: acyl-CoA dehydrogenase family protein [unclassified Streptomyces]|uniref:acyl-CoA dehydrogenase family protein n=1 Tax=unclassified Streptomyces TaxID=2593676 RepID=UPI00224CF544|nr:MULTISPECIES: acyl-CoA dehydrogenase family protein [unclassified Streptomyces]MCX5063057.1 acyl-CoA dehydrogenase family protein [Streptomyces sp. NBC_00452]